MCSAQKDAPGPVTSKRLASDVCGLSGESTQRRELCPPDTERNPPLIWSQDQKPTGKIVLGYFTELVVVSGVCTTPFQTEWLVARHAVAKT